MDKPITLHRLAQEPYAIPPAPPGCTLVIFGATGDLTARKLMPGLYSLAAEGLLPDAFAIVAFARRPKDHAQFRDDMRHAVQRWARHPWNARLWQTLAGRLYYHRASFDDAEGYLQLRSCLQDVSQRHGTQGRTVYYLASPPEASYDIVQHLRAADLTTPRVDDPSWPRLVVEKPFGHDVDSARALQQHLGRALSERQIYRIDHYLGKATVQNLLALRFANAVFEPLWQHQYIDHVQITVSETLGVEDRGGSYDTAGALRDMVQSHLLQLLALVAMEPPHAGDAEAIRDAKTALLASIRPVQGAMLEHDVVRGQYDAGRIGAHDVIGYRDESRVKPDSRTETFVALKLWVDNPRWRGVPFYLRTGKRLPARLAEIAVQFKPASYGYGSGLWSPHTTPNVLTVRIQPDAEVGLVLTAQAPGCERVVQPVRMTSPDNAWGPTAAPDAYERLLLDVMRGDHTRFVRRDEVETAWRVVQPMLTGWQDKPVLGIPTYAAGTWGPPEATRLLRRDGRRWLSSGDP